MPFAPLDYTYDPLELLITKQDVAVAENTTTYAHSGLEEEVVKLTESDARSSVTSRYLHLGQAPLVMERGGQIRFFGTDPHADVVYLADGSGTLVGDHSYSPWGEKRTASGEDPRFEFQGDRRDEDTGLVDMGARLYSPDLGRFTTTDPLTGSITDPISLNRYIYGAANPTSSFDPTGLREVRGTTLDRGRSSMTTSTGTTIPQAAGQVGPSPSNVSGTTRVTSGTVRAEVRHMEPRPAAVAVRRSVSTSVLKFLTAGMPMKTQWEWRLTGGSPPPQSSGGSDLIAKVVVGGLVVIITGGAAAAPTLLRVGASVSRPLARWGSSAVAGLISRFGNRAASAERTVRAIGPAGNPAAFPRLTTTATQLQTKFKHAGDFGITGNYNPANAALYRKALQSHVDVAVRIPGTYRQTISVIHNLDPVSRLNVVQSRSGEFLTAWRLSQAQLRHVLERGSL